MVKAGICAVIFYSVVFFFIPLKMSARLFKVKLSDGTEADVMNIGITYTYENVIEASCFSVCTNDYYARYEERRDLIETGRLKGFFCFEPELTNEYKYGIKWGEDGSVESAEWIKELRGQCFKDNKLCVTLFVNDSDGEYQLTMEWYQTTDELNGTPLPALIQRMASKLSFADVKKYGKFYDWHELEL